MFDKLKNMYDTGRINEKYLIQAIKLGWITEEEKNSIIEIAPEVPIEDTSTAVTEIYENGIQQSWI